MEDNKLSHRAPGIAGWLRRINVILLVIALSLFYNPTPAAAQCIPNPGLEVWGVTGQDGLILYNGVWGYASVWDATVQTGSFYINSLWIIKDDNNILEIGWFEGPDNTRSFFRVWFLNGSYTEDDWGTPGIGTSHFFKIYNINGDQNWHFIVDGVQRGGTLFAGFNKGTIGAMRERQNSCDSGWAHWWNLKRCDYVCNWGLWESITERNYDPAWYLDAISNSNFFVKKN